MLFLKINEKNYRRSWCLFFALLLPSISVAESFKHAFESEVMHEFSQKLPGYAITVIAKDLEFTLIHGLAEKGKPNKIDSDTVFRLASISKTFTPAAFLLANTQRGENPSDESSSVTNSTSDLDNPLVSYLPELELNRDDYQKVLSVRDVLSQTTGLMPHAYTNLVQANVPYKKIVKKLKEVAFVCPPKKCYSYQNVIYSLVGDAIAIKSQQSYEEAVQHTIFKPLNMQRSSIGLEPMLKHKNHASPHRWNKQHKEWQPRKLNGKYYTLSPAAGVNASISDMRQWLKAQLGHQPHVLDSELLNEMHKPHIKTSRKQAHYQRKSWQGVSDMAYGLGWRMFSFNGESGFVHHGGWVEGYRAEMVFNRRLNIGMVFLTNSEPGIASDIVPKFINLYLKRTKTAGGLQQEPAAPVM